MSGKWCLAIVTLLFFAACTGSNDRSPYSFIKTKQEGANTMTLYSVNGQLNNDTLSAFCKKESKKFNTGELHYLVFFDSLKHADFPDGSLTGGYIRWEQLQYINAMYTYNAKNKYNILMVYNGPMGTEIEIK